MIILLVLLGWVLLSVPAALISAAAMNGPCLPPRRRASEVEIAPDLVPVLVRIPGPDWTLGQLERRP